jgi:molybdopterin-guanine dinucleotide biosynthesis protein A
MAAPPIPPAPVAAILCGGRGRRMGGVRKPLLEVGGQPILARQLAVLRPLFAEVILVADEAAPFAGFGAPVLVDPEPGRGPLLAIAAALREVAPAALFVAAGDMPYLAPAPVALTVERAAGAVDLAVPYVGGCPQPLHACYRPACLPAMTRALAAGRLAVYGFYPEVRLARVTEEELRRLDPALAFLRDVNIPADLA